MTKLIRRVDTLVRPEILGMQGYTPGEQPQGGKFIKLNTNENPYPPSPRVAAAIAATAEGGLQRYPDATATAFRMQAADVLGVDKDWILCGNGSDDLLTILTRTFVGPGQSLRMPTPSYVLYRTLAQIQGAQVEEIPFCDDWSLPAEFGRPTEETRLAFVPNPNSPSGTCLSSDQLADIARTIECPLVVDEAYVEFADHDCLSLVAELPNVIVTRTLSKSFALAGLRFGYLVARPEMIEQLRKVKDSYNCDALSIAAATVAIGDQQWLADNRQRVRATRERMTEKLRELGFDAESSQANFVWCNHPSQPAQHLYEQLKQQRILVRYMNYGDWGDGLRISVGTDSQIDALLTILETLL